VCITKTSKIGKRRDGEDVDNSALARELEREDMHQIKTNLKYNNAYLGFGELSAV
jgi:hypothetical protein